jgi:hypothetical protein
MTLSNELETCFSACVSERTTQGNPGTSHQYICLRSHKYVPLAKGAFLFVILVVK